MRNTRPLARQVEKIDSVIILIVSLLFNQAMNMEPSTPTAPLSVGVAQPAKIDPSTNTISVVMGNMPRQRAYQNSLRVCGPKSAGNLGVAPGTRIATAMM